MGAAHAPFNHFTWTTKTLKTLSQRSKPKMANTLLPTVTTLFLLLLTLTTGDTDSDLVLDVDGNPLEVGSLYSIESTINILGGIGRSGRHDTSIPCPLYVVRYPHWHRGDPLKFVPLNGTQTKIHLSSYVKVDSGFSAYCRDDGLWRLGYDDSNNRVVVIASGTFNQPRALFKIEKTGRLLPSYKITTPSLVPALGQEGIYYLTVFVDSPSGMSMVGLTDDPDQALDVLFFKIKKDVAASM